MAARTATVLPTPTSPVMTPSNDSLMQKRMRATASWWLARSHNWAAEMVFENERSTTVIERDGLQVAVVQIASRLVRQIAGFVREGQDVALGQRIGVIRLGSQVDLVMPVHDDVTVTVQPGERVTAGESILAVLGPDTPQGVGHDRQSLAGAPSSERAV